MSRSAVISGPVRRQLSLLATLLRHPHGIALDDCRAGLPAYSAKARDSGLRQLRRDLAALIAEGVPITRATNPETGIPMIGLDAAAYLLPPLVLHAQARRWAVAALDAAAADPDFELPEALHSAHAKLSSRMNPQGGQSAQRGGPPVRRAAPVEALKTITRALRDRMLLKFEYAGYSAPATRRRVYPYGLGFRFGFAYLAAHCLDRKGLRLFRLDRIREPKTTGAVRAFSVPPDFDLQRVLPARPWEIPHGPVVHVTFAAEPAMIPVVTRMFGGQVVWDDNRGEIATPNPGYVVNQILLLGGGVLITGPRGMRVNTIERLRHLAARQRAALVPAAP